MRPLMSTVLCTSALAIGLAGFLQPAAAVGLDAVQVSADLILNDDGSDDLITFDFTGTYFNGFDDFATLDGLQINMANSSPELLAATVTDEFSLFSFSDPTGGLLPPVELATQGLAILTYIPGVLPGTTTTFATITVDASGLAPGTYTVDITGGTPLFDATLGTTTPVLPDLPDLQDRVQPQSPFIPVFFGKSGGAASFTIDGDQPNPEVIPEPLTGTLGLIALASAGLAATRRRR